MSEPSVPEVPKVPRVPKVPQVPNVPRVLVPEVPKVLRVPKVLSLMLAAVLLASAAAAQDTKIDVEKRAVLLATVEARCDECAWDVAGREAATLVLTLNGRYAQHLPIVRTGKSDYRILLGTVPPGTHTARVQVDRRHSARDLRGAGTVTATVAAIEAVVDGDPRYAPLSLAPFLYQRPNTTGRFSDVPVFMWYETDATSRGTRYRYSVVFTNEDGGTPADRLMATWGRTTDIEYVYSVEVDAAGTILEHDYQGPNHEVLPYRGKLEARHARLWVVTDNNMLADRGTAKVRHAPAPVEFPLKDVSREQVMDAYPWLYAVASKELARESKIADNAPPGLGAIPDPRRFVYVEGCADVGTAALAFAVHAAGGWIASDRGVSEYRIVRDGCFRAAIPLPAEATGKDVRAIRVQAFEREGKPAAALVHFRRLNTVFTLDEHYIPGPSLASWQGDAVLTPGGLPLEISIP
jgi:hypothetical protein